MKVQGHTLFSSIHPHIHGWQYPTLWVYGDHQYAKGCWAMVLSILFGQPSSLKLSVEDSSKSINTEDWCPDSGHLNSNSKTLKVPLDIVATWVWLPIQVVFHDKVQIWVGYCWILSCNPVLIHPPVDSFCTYTNIPLELSNWYIAFRRYCLPK